MQSKRNTTTASTFQGYPIRTDEKRGLAIDTELMQKIINQIDYAEQDKSKVFIFRFDLHFPQQEMQAPQDNEHFKRFISAYQKNLSRQGLSPQYIAVREQRRSGNPHYHVLSMLDGQKTRNCYGHIKTAERLWEHELGLEDGTHGLVNYCDKDKETGERMINGMMIDPTKENYELVKDKCVERASYLAKVNQKKMTPKGQREYFASKLPNEYR